MDYYLKTLRTPTPLYFADAPHRELGGAKIYLKREDLLHTGAHKINNCIGQILLAKRNGQNPHHRRNRRGPARASPPPPSRPCSAQVRHLQWGAVDCERQALNVFRMKMLGARSCRSRPGSNVEGSHQRSHARLGHQHVRTTHYILGTVYGAHPYPLMVRQLPARHRRRSARQISGKRERLPDLLIACVGGGSNAMGLFIHSSKMPR